MTIPRTTSTLSGESFRVTGKGRRERVVAVGRKTVRALDRYTRKRIQAPGRFSALALARSKGANDGFPVSDRSSAAVGGKRAWGLSIPTSFATRSLTAGWRKEEARAI